MKATAQIDVRVRCGLAGVSLWLGLAVAAIAGCGGGDAGVTGTGGATGSGGVKATGGTSGSGGARGTGGTPAGTGGARAGTGGALAGTGGTPAGTGGTPVGTGGTLAGTGGAGNGTGGALADAGPDAADAGPAPGDGSADAPGSDGSSPDGLQLGGTPARPQLPAAAGDNYTVAKYLAQAGSLVSGLVTDNWNPTAGLGDVTTFTPTYTVASDGTGTHTTVQAALNDAVAAGGTTRVFIRVMPGTYREIVCLKSATPPITLYGTSADASQTVIVNNNNAGKVYTNPVTGASPNPCASSTLPAVGATYGTSFSATFAAYAKDFQAKNLTIANDFDETGMTSNLQAVALMTQADRLVFENVRLLGNQDTLYTKTNNIDTVMRVYLKGCYVEGDVDFIFGRATTVLDTCEVKYISTRRGGSNGGDLISPSTDTRNSYGMLVANGTFTADSGTAAGTVALGRAWDEGQMLATYPPTGVAGYPNGQLLIRDSVLGGHVSNSAPWVAAASTSRPFSATAGTYPANRLWELNNSGDGAAH